MACSGMSSVGFPTGLQGRLPRLNQRTSITTCFPLPSTGRGARARRLCAVRGDELRARARGVPTQPCLLAQRVLRGGRCRCSRSPSCGGGDGGGARRRGRCRLGSLLAWTRDFGVWTRDPSRGDPGCRVGGGGGGGAGRT